MTALLVAAPDQAAAVRVLAAHQEVAGVIWQGARHALTPELPHFDSVPRALPVARPDMLCVLTPYRALVRDLECALEAGISCLCAGPPETAQTRAAALQERATGGRLRLQWDGLSQASSTFRRLLELRQRPAFGRPVYLRWVAGNGRSLGRAWWALRDLLLGAVQLLASPPASLWVTAVRHGQTCHATVTLATASGASAQLVVCPQYLPGPGGILLLGTGGLLEAEGDPGLRYASWENTGHGGVEEMLGEPAWLAEFATAVGGELADLPPLSGTGRPLLRALRQALGSQRPVAVQL